MYIFLPWRKRTDPIHSSRLKALRATGGPSRRSALLSQGGERRARQRFPADCRICGELLVDSRRVPICPKCLASFEQIPATICEICGCPLFGLQLKEGKRILSVEERWESVRGAFATRPGSQVDNLRVLLVDDVLTTGATLDACARALREAGAKSVVGAYSGTRNKKSTSKLRGMVE